MFESQPDRKDNLEFRFSPCYNQTRGVNLWVANVVNPLGMGVQFSVFWKLDTNRCNVVTGADITFTGYLILQFCNQLHFASGSYGDFSALTSP